MSARHWHGRLRLRREDLLRYAEASGDMNPIHREDTAAREAGLPGVVAHGMLSLGRLNSWVLTQLPAGWSIAAERARFLKPVRPDEELSLEAEAELDPSGGTPTVTAVLRTDDGSVALRVQMEVAPPARP